uniref:Peritrophin-1 n=1 Tax=Caligus clemensi TaxID=344056 RepID=C1BZW5_CALCM|nr:Peritrophin-1 precursor [Caligus clemensi]
MVVRATLTVISLVLISFAVSDPADDDYYYDYEEYDSPSKSDVYKSNEFNLGALVSAWRDYVKEKRGGHSKRPSHSSNKAAYPSVQKNNRKRPNRFEEEEQETRKNKFEEYEDDKDYCEPRDESYFTPDEVQCDKYYECNIKGEVQEKLCLDGLMFDVKRERCDYPAKVICGDRKKLQEARPSKNCPRQNGFFAWPSGISCQKFWDCREGKGYLQACPEGVIFDPKIDACVTPDQSARKECTGGKFLGFLCPSYTPEQMLRFGNHDRLSHPDNCQKFYSCLRDGSPRLAACPKNTVFNNGTGHCGEPSEVPGCEDFWKKKEEDEYDYYY